MSLLTVLAQVQPEDSSSAAAAVFGVIALVGGFSVFALMSKGRRVLLPLVSVLLGASIGATTIAEAKVSHFTALTLLGFFFSGLLIFGGIGALREGTAIPEVEGIEPEVYPAPPRITPDD